MSITQARNLFRAAIEELQYAGMTDEEIGQYIRRIQKNTRKKAYQRQQVDHRAACITRGWKPVYSAHAPDLSGPSFWIKCSTSEKVFRNPVQAVPL